MVSISGSGSFDKTDRFLSFLSRGDLFRSLTTYAQLGVEALSAATPSKTGETAASWYYEIDISLGGCSIYWCNRHLDEAGTPIAIMLETGHGTGTGGYVQGRDYINPAIRPIFEMIANAVWKEVNSA